MAIRVHKAGPGDVPDILELSSELLPGTDVRARHRWLYEENPSGPAATFLAIDTATHRAVGMTSIFPRRISVAADLEVYGGLGGDGWVRPEFRRQGIATLMHTACRLALEGLGMSLIFGTPLAANLTPLAAAGTANVTRTARWVRPLLAARLGVERVFGNDLLGAWRNIAPRTRLESAESRDARIDAIWMDAREELGIATVRDSAFYGWRFSDAPSGAQRPYVVLERGRPIAACAIERVDVPESRIRIVDLTCKRTHFRAALHAILRAVPGARAVDLRMTDEQASRFGILRCGFVPRERHVLNVMLPHGSRAPVLGNGAHWCFSWADTDIDRTVRPTPAVVPVPDYGKARFSVARRVR